MAAGRSLTNQVAINNLGISSLTRRITDLKRAGYRIKREWHLDHHGRRYAKYRLEGQPSATPPR